jgi:hypothetical protein
MSVDRPLNFQNRTLRKELSKQTSSPTPHPDVPARSNLNMLEPRAGDTELSVQDINTFLGPVSVWEKHYSKAAHTWKHTKNTFGKNYKAAVEALDPIPLQSYLQRDEDACVERQSQALESDQGTSSGVAKSKERSQTDQELDVLAEQLNGRISVFLDKEAEDSKVSTEV